MPSPGFRADVEQFLVPTLSPGDIVIMDNLGSHKGQAVRRLIGCQRQAVLPLFARPQSDRAGLLLQSLVAEDPDPRTSEDTWKQIGNLLDHFTPQECANYLVNAGYAST